MNITLYGIPNCDQVRKARAWLAAHGVDHVFHDFKKAGIERGLIESWLRHLEWEALLNRKGTTWRGLSDARRLSITDAGSAIALMLESPSLIKRPVLATGSTACVGFSEPLYQRLFKN